jgi:hypothetical protein
MFVKLLTLLFFNVFVSFSVLLCCRSLIEKCGLKVPVSAIKHTELRSSAYALKLERLRSSVDYGSPSYQRSPSTIAYLPAPWEY